MPKKKRRDSKVAASRARAAAPAPEANPADAPATAVAPTPTVGKIVCSVCGHDPTEINSLHGGGFVVRCPIHGAALGADTGAPGYICPDCKGPVAKLIDAPIKDNPGLKLLLCPNCGAVEYTPPPPQP
jgi:transcription elongation factor Elf1